MSYQIHRAVVIEASISSPTNNFKDQHSKAINIRLYRNNSFHSILRIQSKLKNAVVLRYSNDLDLINVVLEMLPDCEVFFSDIYFSHCCHNDMIHEFDYHQLIYGAGMFQNRSFQC